ncbi:hypothetical protein [Cryobacterium luteum]|uniref:hypothetical protein n=1 Tax=Cryobacterium luteum TaxID=1424661 RepID=UPI00106BE63F|nr:hypothetical protein [Cryobacterium luteum]
MTTVGILLLIVATLSGCSANPTPSDTASPIADATAAPTETAPVFSSNEEALAAAKAAYANYAALSDDVMRSAPAPKDFTKVSASVSEAYLPQVVQALDSFSTAGHIGKGASSFDSIALIRYSDSPYGLAEVEVYMCSDVSGLRLLDASGADVTPAQRIDRVPLQVRFVSSVGSPSTLLVDKEDVWSGRDFC